MQHISPDDLAWRAAQRVDGVGDIDAHLLECPQCSAELAALQRVVTQLRADAVEPAPLPPALWDRIAAAVAEPEDADASVVADAVATEARGADDRAPDVRAVHGSQALVRAPRRKARRRFRARTLVAACVVTALVVAGGIGVGAWIAQREPDESVLASIALDPLADGIGDASAQIVERDGHRVLVIDADALPAAAGGFLDVWLIDADVEGMVNVGILDGVSGEYVLPDDLDLDRYPIVDVSIEPLDGDPTHSGDSVWRGTLT